MGKVQLGVCEMLGDHMTTRIAACLFMTLQHALLFFCWGGRAAQYAS